MPRRMDPRKPGMDSDTRELSTTFFNSDERTSTIFVISFKKISLKIFLIIDQYPVEILNDDIIQYFNIFCFFAG